MSISLFLRITESLGMFERLREHKQFIFNIHAFMLFHIKSLRLQDNGIRSSYSKPIGRQQREVYQECQSWVVVHSMGCHSGWRNKAFNVRRLWSQEFLHMVEQHTILILLNFPWGSTHSCIALWDSRIFKRQDYKRNVWIKWDYLGHKF